MLLNDQKVVTEEILSDMMSCFVKWLLLNYDLKMVGLCFEGWEYVTLCLEFEGQAYVNAAFPVYTLHAQKSTHRATNNVKT